MPFRFFVWQHIPFDDGVHTLRIRAKINIQTAPEPRSGAISILGSEGIWQEP